LLIAGPGQRIKISLAILPNIQVMR
jgi:hypothetical protein